MLSFSLDFLFLLLQSYKTFFNPKCALTAVEFQPDVIVAKLSGL